MKKFAPVFAMAVLLSSPVHAKEGFLEKLLRIASAPATSGAPIASNATAPARRPSSVVQPSNAQVADLQKALAVQQGDPRIARDISEAKPLIERLAQTGACAVDTGAWNTFAREMVRPQHWLDGYYMHLPRAGDKYHDPRSCLDVMRFSDFTKPAANALSFRVYFISPQSERARNQTFIIMKSPEGQWLVDKIGYAA